MKNSMTLLIVLILLTACMLFPAQDPSVSHREVFQEIYEVLDENYIFFNYKGIDWEQVYQHYLPQVSDTLDDSIFFDLMSSFVNELQDGHTRIHNGVRVSHYDFIRGAPENFDRDLLDIYLDSTYMSAGKILYKAFDDIGYIYIPNFWDGTEHEPFDSILSLYAEKSGLIIDIRHNGGGSNYSCKLIASHFISESFIGEKWYVKNGPDHDDIRFMSEVTITPNNFITFHKPVALLVNRNVYSAANDFANLMESIPGVFLVGDTTGGGGGVPRQYILRNNWNLFYCDTYTLNGRDEQLENGIAPDIHVDLDTMNTGTDEILETALRVLRSQ